MIISKTTASIYSAFTTSKVFTQEASRNDVFCGLLNDSQARTDTPRQPNTLTVNYGGHISVIPSLTQDTPAVTRTDLTEEDKQLWHNGKPESLEFTGAGGPICNGGKKEYHSYFNVYYTAGSETVRQACAFYDTNSPEDSPVMYIWEYGCTTQSYGDDVLLKIEVNKIDPSNASYEEMIALAGYIYRDDPIAAGEASGAIDMARAYMEADGIEWQQGAHDYTSYYLPEVVRRNKIIPTPRIRHSQRPLKTS